MEESLGTEYFWKPSTVEGLGKDLKYGQTCEMANVTAEALRLSDHH